MNDPALREIPRRVHLVGVGGIHMSGIARILRSRGHLLSGSDLHLSPLTEELEQIGVTMHQGHRAENVGEAELVVYTSAAKPDNPELLEAGRRGIPTVKRAQMVARLMEGKQVIAVAGTHGKTTTSSLVAYMLSRAGLSPTFMIGGETPDLGTNARPGDGPHFVVEADEYDRAFLNYHPHIALVTNVEPDHLDIYGGFEDLRQAFAQFLSQVENTGFIIACKDSPALQASLPPTVGGDVNHPVHAVSYGLDPEADWTAENISSVTPGTEGRKGIDGSTFVVKYRKQVWGAVQTRLAGVHNVTNCLGAIATGQVLDLPRDIILEAVSEFRGAHRRFELTGDAAGVTVMDDYAHHPTEIEATIAAARSHFPGRRLVCLFQPHTYSRTSYLIDGFRTCFAGCDVLLIADTYAAREEPSAGMGAEELTREVRDPPAAYSGGLEESARAAADVLRPGDVFFTIGAGDVDTVGPKVLEMLRSGGRQTRPDPTGAEA